MLVMGIAYDDTAMELAELNPTEISEIEPVYPADDVIVSAPPTTKLVDDSISCVVGPLSVNVAEPVILVRLSNRKTPMLPPLVTANEPATVVRAEKSMEKA
jgi:hypothetical protein